MKKLAAALIFLFGLASAALAQTPGGVPATMYSVVFGGSTTAMTKIVSGSATKTIYVTSIASHPAPTAVLTLSYGTGTNCGTGTVNFYGPATFQGGENVYIGSGYGAVFIVPKGNDVCVTVATAAAPGWLSYSQY